MMKWIKFEMEKLSKSEIYVEFKNFNGNKVNCTTFEGQLGIKQVKWKTKYYIYKDTICELFTYVKEVVKNIAKKYGLYYSSGLYSIRVYDTYPYEKIKFLEKAYQEIKKTVREIEVKMNQIIGKMFNLTEEYQKLPKDEIWINWEGGYGDFKIFNSHKYNKKFILAGLDNVVSLIPIDIKNGLMEDWEFEIFPCGEIKIRGDKLREYVKTNNIDLSEVFTYQKTNYLSNSGLSGIVVFGIIGKFEKVLKMERLDTKYGYRWCKQNKNRKGVVCVNRGSLEFSIS